MAVLMVESWDKYATGLYSANVSGLGTGWNALESGGSVAAASSTLSRNGDTTLGLGQYMSMNGGHGVSWSPASPNATDDATWVVGFAALTTAVAAQGWICNLWGDAGLTQHIQVRCNTALGALVVLRGDGTTLGTSANGVWTVGWHYVEIKVVLGDGTSGSVIVKIDGATIFNLTGQDTKNAGTNAYFDAVRIKENAGNEFRLDDIILINTAAGAATDFVGDGRIQARSANGAGATTQWSPSAGSNFQNVDDYPAADDDTTYNSETTLNEKDTYTFENLTATTGTIKGVQLTVKSRKDTAANKSIRLLARSSGGTEADNGADLALGTSYNHYRSVFQTEPGGATWDITKFNAAEFGQKLVVSN